jgi:hypothetical protein
MEFDVGLPRSRHREGASREREHILLRSRAFYRLSTNGHRHRLSVMPEPQLAGCQPSVDAKFGVVCGLTDPGLKGTGPVNRQVAVCRERLPKLPLMSGASRNSKNP